ncbi:hypothetical protein [Streptomyces phaeochromogenes]|uniref:hypothetical protein n=1 Tax=Streptomyces phaeochromogenes TaxID=1923 RepID=UPI002DD96E49|nr:hypothetical protein [Streptomyces phaeochromogenes]WRZ32109.1 hypothetical protein OG931_32465 [Streptomyces phaeochromogenes]
MNTTGTRGDTQLGMALDLSNEGRPRPDVAVRVRIGLGHPGDPRPGLERKLDGSWKKVELAPDKQGLTGTFRMDLPRGNSLAFLRITPRVSPRAEGEGLPVDVTMTDGSRTLARKQQTARLATLSLNRVSPKEPAVLRTGRWTEVVYTITNHSRSSYPKAQVQAEYSACAADSDDQSNTDTCPDGAAQSSATSLRTQWHDGTGWRDVTVPDDGSLLAETLTMPFGTLAADSTRTFRFRFTGSEELDANVRRLVITARVNGKAVGAAERSLGIASPLTFDIR